jgi:hypothetical protein
MTVHAVLERALNNGVKLYVDGGKLRAPLCQGEIFSLFCAASTRRKS